MILTSRSVSVLHVISFKNLRKGSPRLQGPRRRKKKRRKKNEKKLDTELKLTYTPEFSATVCEQKRCKEVTKGTKWRSS
jgi:hypothetical protein